MFTVKWQAAVDGVERDRIFYTPEVNTAFPDGTTSEDPVAKPTLGVYDVPSSGLVVIGNPGHGAESHAFACGRVFVMNEFGKTVATYRLPDATSSTPGKYADQHNACRPEAPDPPWF